jgi:hypothetical protein
VIRYTVRTTPWTMLVVGCGVVAGLVTIVAHRPGSMWPLQGTAVGVIAGVVAWSMDERTAPIVDTLPRPHWWRTVARALVVVPALLGLWVACLAAFRDRLPDHFGLFVVHGVVATVLALAVTVWRRSRGAAEPGAAFATYVIPAATALALIRPVARWLPVFPIWETERWALSWALWLTVGGLAAVMLVSTLARDQRA